MFGTTWVCAAVCRGDIEKCGGHSCSAAAARLRYNAVPVRGTVHGRRIDHIQRGYRRRRPVKDDCTDPNGAVNADRWLECNSKPVGWKLEHTAQGGTVPPNLGEYFKTVIACNYRVKVRELERRTQGRHLTEHSIDSMAHECLTIAQLTVTVTQAAADYTILIFLSTVEWR